MNFEEILKDNDYFTVSFFDVPRHPALQVCGTKHGNECDKIKLGSQASLGKGIRYHPQFVEF